MIKHTKIISRTAWTLLAIALAVGSLSTELIIAEFLHPDAVTTLRLGNRVVILSGDTIAFRIAK